MFFVLRPAPRRVRGGAGECVNRAQTSYYDAVTVTPREQCVLGALGVQTNRTPRAGQGVMGKSRSRDKGLEVLTRVVARALWWQAAAPPALAAWAQTARHGLPCTSWACKRRPRLDTAAACRRPRMNSPPINAVTPFYCCAQGRDYDPCRGLLRHGSRAHRQRCMLPRRATNEVRSRIRAPLSSAPSLPFP